MGKKSAQNPPRKSLSIALVCCLTLLSWTMVAESQGRSDTLQARPFLKTPLSFEANVGQVDAHVHYLSRGPGYGVFLTPTEAILMIQRSTTAPHREAIAGQPNDRPSTLQEATLRFHFLGTEGRTLLPIGREQLPGQSHYFLGNDPSGWHTHIPHYAKVVYEELYPGIDLIYYGRNGQLKYDLVVAPGANPEEILLEIQGAERLTLLPEGMLRIETPVAEVRQHKPVIYQERNGVKHLIAGAYRLREANRVSFEIGAFDHSRPLYIDPILSYGSYFGSDGVYSLALDAEGNLYLTGATGPSLRTIGSVQRSPQGFLDAFVSKFDRTGTRLRYSTYLGGSLDDQGRDIAVDNDGNAYVVGITSSSDFPTAIPNQSQNGGSYDVFVAKLRASGSRLEYSTYLGGSEEDGLLGDLALALDTQGDVYLSGSTNSSDFPTVSPDFPFVTALQPGYGGGVDAFVAKMGGAEPTLLYSTYLGGANSEYGGDLAVDEGGQAYVVGTTFSENFPKANPLQPQLGGERDLFISKLTADGLGLVYSTYLGGSDRDEGRGLAVDTSGQVYVTGYTKSANYPVVNPVQARLAGRSDIIVSQLNAAGTSLQYSTFVGGSGEDEGFGISVDSNGQAWVTGWTRGNGFPVTPTALQPTPGMGGVVANRDAFVLQLSSAGSTLEYASYLGGDGDDEGRAIEVMKVEDLTYTFVGGRTESSDFPRTIPFQAAPSGGFVAILSEINPQDPPPTSDLMITMGDTPDPVERGRLLTYTITVANAGPDDTRGVTVTDILPPRFRVTDVSASQGTCGVEPLVCDLRSMRSGKQATITISGIPLAAPISLANSASVLSDFPDPTLSNNSVKVFTAVTAPANAPLADLALIKNDNADPATLGQPFRYTLEVRNNGPNTAPDVILTETLPQHVALGSVNPTQGKCSGNRELVCQLGNLQSGSAATVTLEVIPQTTTSLFNQAHVTSSATDPSTGNNTETEVTRIKAPQPEEEADLGVIVTDQEDPINPDISSGKGLATYKLMVFNGGPGIATDVMVASRIDVMKIDGIPPVTFEDFKVSNPMKAGQDPNSNTVECASCMGLDCTDRLKEMLPEILEILEDQLLVICDVGNLSLDQTFTLDIQANLTQGIHSNTGSAFTTASDPDLGNNQSTQSTTVAVPAGYPPRGGTGGNDSGCFIATAAYGSPLAREVVVLRQFRDQFLLSSTGGQLLVRAYYFTSPPLAAVISQHSELKTVVQVALWPVVWWAHLTLTAPALGLAVFSGILLVICSLLYSIIRLSRRHRSLGI